MVVVVVGKQDGVTKVKEGKDSPIENLRLLGVIKQVCGSDGMVSCEIDKDCMYRAVNTKA